LVAQLIEFPEDLETALGVPKQKRSLVPDAVERVPLDPSGPREIRDLAEALRRLVGRP